MVIRFTRWAVIGLAACGLMALGACQPAQPPDDPGLDMITLRPTQPERTPAYTAHAPATAHDIVTMTPSEGACTEAEIAAILRSMPAYAPGGGAFARLDAGGFVIDGARFVVRGINYFPSLHPWHRFHKTQLSIVEHDFALLRASGVNTVRLFLWYDPFFVCPGSGAIPNQDAFLWLDAVFRLAGAYDLRVILVLHDLLDLRAQALYTEPGDTLAQTAFIVNRYREEPALLAWDLRDAGDADYTPFTDDPAPFSRAEVLEWLARSAAIVRQLDPDRPITAGWAGDAEATIPAVDVVSFQHFGDADELRARVAALRTYTDKPILLIAVGSSTYHHTEVEQAQYLRETIRAAEGDQLAGWLVWTMYDFPVNVTCYPEPCASLDDERHHFGLWRVDGSRKPAANALETLASGP